MAHASERAAFRKPLVYVLLLLVTMMLCLISCPNSRLRVRSGRIYLDVVFATISALESRKATLGTCADPPNECNLELLSNVDVYAS